MLGDRVNIAARFQSLANPGGICISGAAYDYVRKTLSFSFTDLGSGMKILRSSAYHFPPIPQNADPLCRSHLPLFSDKPSLTVLPFRNLSEDREHLYFAEGLRDDLIAALLRFSGLVIIPSSSRPDPQRIGHSAADLGATYLLEGSVRCSGHHARVTTQLTGPSGEGVWAEKYDFELDDIFTVQDELARSIPAALKIELEEHERYLALTKPPANLAAYDYYLRGRHLERSLAQVDRRRAISMFVKAIEVDPQYSRGYLGLARTKILSSRWNEPSDPATVLPKRLMLRSQQQHRTRMTPSVIGRWV